MPISIRASRLTSRLALCVVVAGAALAPCTAAVPTKGTEILWDRYGIPHIVAKDHQSLFYAYGYAQMEAHSELLVRLQVWTGTSSRPTGECEEDGCSLRAEPPSSMEARRVVARRARIIGGQSTTLARAEGVDGSTRRTA